ncbi:hypothetical protein [Actibacterium sp. MT2.3-13A]|uniref:hypothetical protein n=1 Tax=Actibacterium sp. MT2.3-13A TaxID=2828332 RepID=UPI001BA76EDB|nr:hypothetical protein [Actibacterium sp. MT2.3-13A]
MSKSDTHQIIDAIGVDALTEIGLSERNIRHAKSSGQFAAQWYERIKFLCDEQGIECPLSSFSFKPIDKNIGSDHEEFKRAAQ